MHGPMTPSAACLAAALAVLPAAGVAQPGPAKPGVTEADPARSIGTEALALFVRICLGALGRGETPLAVASRELAGERPVPQEQLRSNGPARETAGWRVQGRHTVMLLEPGTQCAVYTEGVNPAAFLEEARLLMQRPDAVPGWIRRGEPQNSSSPRPFGTLTFLRVRYARLLPPPDARPAEGAVPLPAASIIASAAERTDGRPNTAVISVGMEAAPGR